MLNLQALDYEEIRLGSSWNHLQNQTQKIVPAHNNKTTDEYYTCLLISCNLWFS